MEALETAFTTAVASVQGDILGYAAIAIPAGLLIFGAFQALRLGLGFFKTATGRR